MNPFYSKYLSVETEALFDKIKGLYDKAALDDLLAGLSKTDHTHNGYAPTSHNHNDLYFTKDEITQKLAAIAPTLTPEQIAAITAEIVANFDLSDYYTKTEVDAKHDQLLADSVGISSLGALACKAFYTDADIQWTKGTNYNQDGTISNNGAWSTALVDVVSNIIITNINTGGTWIVFFNTEGGVISAIKKDNNNTESISVPIGSAKIGLTNKWMNQTYTPFVIGIAITRTIKDIDLAIKKLQSDVISADIKATGGKLAYDAFYTDIAWTKGTNYNPDGTISNNYAWETALVDAGLSEIITNINSAVDGIVFFDADGGVISAVAKTNNNTETIVLPTGTKKIGLTNKWTSQDSPIVLGLAISRTIKDVDADVKQLQVKTQSVKDRVIMSVIGDSISSDIESAGMLGWPKTLAINLNADIDRYTQPGARLTNYLPTVAPKIRSDADLVIMAMGRNDVSRDIPLGDIETILTYDTANIPQNTVLGIYRYQLETLKARLDSNALMVCLAPITDLLLDKVGGTHYNQEYQDMRAGIRKICLHNGGSNSGWIYIDGTKIGLDIDDGDIYYNDTTHPNAAGEAIIASAIYNRLPDIGSWKKRNI